MRIWLCQSIHDIINTIIIRGKVSDWVCYSKCVNFIMRVKDMKLWVWMHKNLSVKVWEQAYDSLSIRL